MVPVFGPNYAEKHRRMGDQVTAFVALTMRRKMQIAQEWLGRPVAAATQHPLPDLAILPRFCRQQPSNESRRRSRLVYFGDIQQPIHHLGLRAWDPKTKGECSCTVRTLEKQRRNGGRKVACPKAFPPCHDAGPLWRSRARGCGVSGANLACVHRHTPRQTSMVPQWHFYVHPYLYHRGFW